MPAEKQYLLVGLDIERSKARTIGYGPCGQAGCSAFLSYTDLAPNWVKITRRCENRTTGTDDTLCKMACDSATFQAANALWDVIKLEKPDDQIAD